MANQQQGGWWPPGAFFFNSSLSHFNNLMRKHGNIKYLFLFLQLFSSKAGIGT